MKFRIRFADQIVGFLIVLAIVSLAFIIVMLGRAQRWFARDTPFRTEFVSATGLSRNMPVQYKGFTIGNVSAFNLNDSDQVEVDFFIYEQYRDRVRLGSMVELMVSPVGLGNQFLFHPGKGEEPVLDGDFIPSAESALARSYIRQGLADLPRHDDSISLIMNRASSTLDMAYRVLAQLEEAFGTGSGETPIGQLMASLNRVVAGAETLPETIQGTADSLLADVDELKALLDSTLADVNPILTDLSTLTGMLASPDGSVAEVLDSGGEVYRSLTASLASLSGIMADLDTTASFVPRQLPQIAGLIADLRVTLKTAEDVLVALTNNPLLKGGIPDHVEVQSSGTSPRDIKF